jgi:enoyl-CoA hydratase/carnithine racemase
MLDHPPVNALSESMVDEILEALAMARDDPGVRAVLLGSKVEGRFCAGLDLRAFQQASSTRVHSLLEKLYVRLCDAQFNLGKPSIAVVSGAARGGGMTLAISCDLILATRSATFGYPEIDIGVIPAIHYAHLPRVIGRHRAFDYLFTGRSFGPAEALALGLVSRVVDDALGLEEARKLADVLAAKSPQVMKMARAAFMRANDADYRRSVAGAVESFCTVAATDDSREGVAAFLEKREPNWPSARNG